MEIYLRGGWASRVMKRIKGSLDATPSGAELTGLYARRANTWTRRPGGHSDTSPP